MSRTLLFSVGKSDLRVDTFCTGGPGGQNQNKREMGVRITHIPSGAVGEAREARYQHLNKKLALERLAEHKLFKAWVTRKAAEMASQETTEERLDRQMAPSNLKIEVKDESGKWAEEKTDGE